jgi:hypothetical protein
VSAGPIEAIEAALERGGEPDDVLRSAVDALAAEPAVSWAGIAFLEAGQLVVGPQAGGEDETRRMRVPVEFEGATVGELWVDGEADAAVLARIAALISGHVLIGWDTGGEAWDP